MSTALRLIGTLSLIPLIFGGDGSACAVPHVATASQITEGADTILLVKSESPQRGDSASISDRDDDLGGTEGRLQT